MPDTSLVSARSVWASISVRIREDFPAEQLVHGHDERIPIDGYVWGLQAFYEIVTQFCSM